MFELITITEAAKLLGVHPNTLRRHEDSAGRWCEIYGIRFRVYRLSADKKAQRRYDRNEIERLLNLSAHRQTGGSQGG